MKKLASLISILLLSVTLSGWAQSSKAKSGTFALTNATIETVTKGTITNGTVLIRNGKIEAVGTNVQVPAGAQVIDCKGQFIYPGMIDGSTRIGLKEIGTIPTASDEGDLGNVIPQMRALSAINPNSAVIPVTRVSGLTTALSIPQGGLFPGIASLVNLHGYTPDQMYAGFDALVLNFPSSARRGFDRRSEDDIKKEFDKGMKQLNEVWEKAIQYHKLDSATRGKGVTYYPELQAILPVARGEMTLLIDVDAANDIKAALKWISEKKINKVILMGVQEGWRVAEEIAKAKIPVLAGPVIAIPSREYDRYDAAYANPGLMRKAGVTVAICTQEIGMSNYRNLPYHAGFAVAYGMTKEDALKAITIVPAEIFGVSNRLGSIEAGKDATLFVCDGDPFETKTQVKHVFIDGWQIPMESRQTLLYDEFLKRDPGLKKN